ncbi:MAG: thioesterase family protein [Desulfosalsimonas sp.]
MNIFEKDIYVKAAEPWLFKTEVSPRWSVNETANGGYLLAILANATATLTDKTATPVLTANYISRTLTEKAEIAVEQFSRSRQFNRYQASLLQGGDEKVRAFATFAAESAQDPIQRYEEPPPQIAAFEDCIRIPAMPGYSIFENLDVYLDPECAGWMENRPSEKSEQKGWVRFPDETRFNLLSVLLAADAFPPAVLASQGMKAWVPTLEFSVSVRSIPDSARLKGRFRTRFINCGILEEDGELWDENNELVAVSRQIARFSPQRR